MCESATTHLYPSLNECPVCHCKLSEWYRKERTIYSLKGPIYLVSHIYCCENQECANYHQGIQPEEESLLAIKGYNYGLDVIIKTGHLRHLDHKTWQAIQEILEQEFQLKISEREVGYLIEAYLALTNLVAKKDRELLEKLEKLTGLILAIDGIQPDNSNEILYLIREIQTGQILAAKVIESSHNDQLQKLVQEAMDLGFPILGVVSDKEGAILKAVQAKLPNIPHQLCHYHYLKNLTLDIVEADSRLRSGIKLFISDQVKYATKAINKEDLRTYMPEKAPGVIKGYCLAIKTLFKRKSTYPLKPNGLPLYRDMLKIQESLYSSVSYTYNYYLEQIYLRVESILTSYAEDAKRVETGYRWIYKIASFLGKKENISEEEKREKLTHLINSLSDHNDPVLASWLSRMKRITPEWLPGLFRHYSQPLLPKTNNDLEVFNGKVRKIYRKITGRKRTQNFISKWGASVSFLLGISTDLDLLLKFSSIPYNEFRAQREDLFDRDLSSKTYCIRHNLDDYLFDLEYQWSIPEDCTNKLCGMIPPPPGPYRNYESPFFETYEEENSNMR